MPILRTGTRRVDFQSVRLDFQFVMNGDWFTYCYVNKELPGPNYPSDIENWQPNPVFRNYQFKAR